MHLTVNAPGVILLRTLSAASVSPPDALLTCERTAAARDHSAISPLSSHLHPYTSHLSHPPTPPVAAYVTASNNATAASPNRPLALRAAGGEQPCATCEALRTETLPVSEHRGADGHGLAYFLNSLARFNVVRIFHFSFLIFYSTYVWFREKWILKNFSFPRRVDLK